MKILSLVNHPLVSTNLYDIVVFSVKRQRCFFFVFFYNDGPVSFWTPFTCMDYIDEKMSKHS